jgi:PIN domain nuclease of toxin-antitoxin system
VLILDTCALIFDALTPERLSAKASAAIKQADKAGRLACADISLWEIAMLISKGRIDPGTDPKTFIQLVLAARAIKVQPVTPEIAAKSVQTNFCSHGDPADRLIAATAMLSKARLVTSDKKLADVSGLQIVW